jgi:asparagine synthase (glutamine-hydrolysing)
MGFSVPLAQWFRGPLRQRVTDSVLGETLAATDIFSRKTLESMLVDHQRGARDHSSPLWTLLMFEAFLRNVNGDARSAREAA